VTIIEMHIAIRQGVDKINSLQADDLQSEEIDLEINKSIQRFINTKFGRNNIYQKGFEESQKRIDDLRTLIRSSEDTVTFLEQYSENIFIDSFELPGDYMYLVNQRSKVWINNCRPIEYEINVQPLYFLTLDLNNFVANNPNNSAGEFLVSIDLYENQSALGFSIANIWKPSQDLMTAGWTSDSYPQNIEVTREDILANPGTGFDIYWESYRGLNFPGQFIVIVDEETHPWINWDPSLGAVSTAVGAPNPLSGINAPTAQTLQTIDDPTSYRRIPVETSDIKTVRNRFSQQDDVHMLLEDPFNTTKWDKPITTIRNNAIDIYTSDIFIIESVKIQYLRKPTPVSLSLGTDCELPEHTHQEIVSMTVSSILETIADPRYATSRGEVDKNE